MTIPRSYNLLKYLVDQPAEEVATARATPSPAIIAPAARQNAHRAELKGKNVPRSYNLLKYFVDQPAEEVATARATPSPAIIAPAARQNAHCAELKGKNVPRSYNLLKYFVDQPAEEVATARATPSPVFKQSEYGRRFFCVDGEEIPSPGRYPTLRSYHSIIKGTPP